MSPTIVLILFIVACLYYVIPIGITTHDEREFSVRGYRWYKECGQWAFKQLY